MSYVCIALVPLAFVVGRYIGMVKARDILRRVREARDRGLVPELNGEP